MDTNLKTSKKIRLFIYRILFVGTFFTMLATAWLGREAFYTLKTEGKGILTGELYYLPEFREYISSLYTYGLVGYVGAGDDNGYALNMHDSILAAQAAIDAFNEEIIKGKADLVYHLKRDIFVQLVGNVSQPIYSKQDGHLLLPEDVILCAYLDGPNNKLLFFEEDAYQTDLSPDQYFTYRYQADSTKIMKTNFLIALKDTDTYSSPYLQELDRLAKNYRLIIITFLVSVASFLLLCLPRLITFRATRRTFREFSTLTGKLYLEFKLLLVVGLCTFGQYYHLWCFPNSREIRFRVIPYLWLYGLIFIIFYLLLLDIRHNGLNTLRTSLIQVIFDNIRQYLKGTKWYRKAALMYFLYFATSILILGMGTLLIFVCTGLLPGYMPSSQKGLLVIAILLTVFGLLMLLLSARLKHFVADTVAIAAKLADVNSGKTGDDVQLSPHSLLTHMATDVTNVQKGIETAVEENLRANRMRVELITNVSHDLKTPLTSIINYSDLLCEENLPPTAMEYSKALRAKAYRLKGMVQDVFELSKATSGNLPIEKTQLDLTRLIQQTLADMDERIQESSLTFKPDISTSPLIIEADGEKMYRVFQNLIVNALQYSLENSRVYIEVTKQEQNAYVQIKNISRQELDFDPEEIVERFVRADASRTTEGSGLGLSIVQSFTEACGGKFSIELNADLFTAIVCFPLSSKPSLDLDLPEET